MKFFLHQIVPHITRYHCTKFHSKILILCEVILLHTKKLENWVLRSFLKIFSITPTLLHYVDFISSSTLFVLVYSFSMLYYLAKTAKRTENQFFKLAQSQFD